MKQLYKNFYLLSFFAIVLSISVSGQTEFKQSPEPKPLSETPSKISELIPIKEGTELKPIDQPKETFEKGNVELFPPKQTQNYVRPSKKERFNRYLNRTIGTGLIGVGASSIVQQISENPPEWEKNSEGFLRRVGSNLGTQVISESIAYGLEESLKLDSKFYKSKKKDFGSRVKNAFLSSFTARTPSGKRVFNPSRIAGRYTANIIATETWFPERFSYKDGLRQGTRGIGFNIGLNFLREFVFPD